MRNLVGDVFARFDEVCRSIKALRDADLQRVQAPSISHAEFEAAITDSAEQSDNGYANHIALGMAKMRDRL